MWRQFVKVVFIKTRERKREGERERRGVALRAEDDFLSLYQF